MSAGVSKPTHSSVQLQSGVVGASNRVGHRLTCRVGFLFFCAFVQKLGLPDELCVGGKHGQERLDGMEKVGLPKHTKDWTQ